MSSRKLGLFGEKIALRYLKNQGYRILARNYIPKFIPGPQKGEIDIIARKSGVFHFVEVKALAENGRDIFFPEDKVNFSKYEKIRKTAEFWLMKNNIPSESGWQIDVVAIVIEPDFKKAKIRFFENVGF